MTNFVLTFSEHDGIFKPFGCYDQPIILIILLDGSPTPQVDKIEFLAEDLFILFY